MHELILILALASSALGWVMEMENPGLYQGDMVLSPDQRQEVKDGTFKFGSISNQERLWPKSSNGYVEIPYSIDSTLRHESEALREIKVSIGEYEKYTCLRFKKWSGEKSYINFYNRGGGCNSPVGRNCRYGRCSVNKISLSKGCWWRSTVMHEMGHSLGLHHEQSRPDRDSHVKILTHNIHKGTMFNFDKESYKDVDSLGTPYDYLSMMHYKWNAFGIDQRMTIKTADPKYQYEIGQDRGFSQIDVEQINKLYKCSGNYPKPDPYVLIPGCYDIGAACAKSRYEGNCNKRQWVRYLHKNCRRSCGLCGGNPPPGPQTHKPITFPPINPETSNPNPRTSDPNCKDRVVDCHVNRDRCHSTSSAWKRFMQRSCRKTCKFC